MKEKINLNTFLLGIIISMGGFWGIRVINDIDFIKIGLNDTIVRVGKLETNVDYLKDDIKKIEVKL